MFISFDVELTGKVSASMSHAMCLLLWPKLYTTRSTLIRPSVARTGETYAEKLLRASVQQHFGTTSRCSTNQYVLCTHMGKPNLLYIKSARIIRTTR